MYCSSCGNNIPDGASVCPECGQDPAPKRPIGSTISMSSAKESASGIADKLKTVSASLVAKIAFLAAILCFAFPFVTISCDASDYANSYYETDEDYSMEVTYKGYNFIFPSTVDEDNVELGKGFKEKESSDSDADDEETNGWLIAVVVCCSAGAALLFIKKSDWLPAISAGLGFAGIICLSSFKSGFADRYINSENSSGVSLENFLDIDYRYGYSLCMLFMMIAAIASSITFLTEKFRYDKKF